MEEKGIDTGEWVGAGPVERFYVDRKGYRHILGEVYQRLVFERAKKVSSGDHSYTEFEAMLPLLVKFLLPEENQKCRIVVEYDPAKRMMECYHLYGETLQAVDWATVGD